VQLLLVRQLGRASVVEIQVDNPEAEASPPIVWSPADSPDSRAGTMGTHGEWVEIRESDDDDAAGERSDDDASTRSGSSGSSSPSMAGSTEDGGSWATFDDGDEKSLDDEEMGSLLDISGDTADIVNVIMSTSVGGRCGLGGGLCNTSADVGKSNRDTVSEKGDSGELPAREDRGAEARSIKEVRGVTVAQYLLCASQDVDPLLDRKSNQDDASLADSGTVNESVDGDDRDSDEEQKRGYEEDGVISRRHDAVMSQYLCCGQDHGLLVQDSYDLEDSVAS
jgi:hypothetical protein